MERRDEIERLAYEIYEKSGRVEGRDIENWLEAERIISAKYAEKEKAEREKVIAKKKPVSKATPKLRAGK